MPAHRKRPDDATLKRLWNNGNGLTERQIAEKYNCTPITIYTALRDLGLTSVRPDRKRTLPWTIATKHQNTNTAKMLRLLDQRIENEENGDDRYRGFAKRSIQPLEAWLKYLDENNLVVDYRRTKGPNEAEDVKGGFFYRERTDEDGEIPIRMPKMRRDARTRKLKAV